MSKIFTIGDSHSRFGFQEIEKVTCIHIGPRLMFSVGEKGLDVTQYNISEESVLIFCFGEIDCRCHINKYHETYKSTIYSIVEKYFEMIQENAKKFKNLTIAVYNVVPPVEKSKKGHLMMGDYPFQGTDEERKLYTMFMNKCLKEFCEKFHYIYFDVYDKYCCENGFLQENLSDGIVHIRDPIFLKTFINENLK